uniref:Protein TsetseEP domain-containing protein n=1 Tax=Photinus pyralis TaxID=7054 RepID=A0A1Y1KRD8_PHOPY
MMNFPILLLVIWQVLPAHFTPSCEKPLREELQTKYLNEISEKVKAIGVFPATKSKCKTDIDVNLKNARAMIEENKGKVEETCLLRLQGELDDISGSYNDVLENCERPIEKDVENSARIMRSNLAAVVGCVVGKGTCEEIESCCKNVVSSVHANGLPALVNQYTTCMQEKCDNLIHNIGTIGRAIVNC